MIPLRRAFRRLSLDAKLVGSYLVILGIGGLAISIVGSWIVSTAIWKEAQRTVTHDLAIARAVYEQQLDLVGRTVEVAASGTTIPAALASGDPGSVGAYLERVRGDSGLDFLSLATPDGRVVVRGGVATEGGGSLFPPIVELVRSAGAGEAVAATEVLPVAALAAESLALADRARLAVLPTPHAAAGGTVQLDAGLAMVAAAPVRGADGTPVGALYGGVLLNQDFSFVDDVWRRLYASQDGEGAPLGTVTVFQDGVRVATTVRGPDGRRAIGTRVSDEVRTAVLERGETWRDRAFVVDDWYLAAYEPIRDHGGRVVGMLYVGLLEETYAATRNRVIVSFFAIATIGFFLVIAVSYWITQGLTRPIRQMVEATRSIARGRFDHEVAVPGDGEMALLAASFNTMQRSLAEMRDDLEEAARTLEDKVRARSEELVKMQARVAQSERLASIGVLAAGVAHEVNNPLGAILALTSLTLEDLPEGDPGRENLEEVVRQTRRCSEIVKHLLEFSRQHRVSTEQVDVNAVLEQTLALVARQSMFFNIAVERRLASELPRIIADQSQLQQVFMNILMNAVQAMEERGTLTLATRYDAERDRVEVRIADTGPGIPPEQIDHVFDPFFTTKESGQGTGLGLSIAYGIVSRHQGTIRVESELGAGTTFTIRLPANAQFQPEHPVSEADALAVVGR